MNLNNFLYSGFKFGGDEDLLQFKFKMLNSIFIIVAFFSALFGLLSDLGINDIGPIHSKVNYVYSFLTIMLIFFLRLSKKNYNLTAHSLLIISLMAFTSALVFVPQDAFRMIWFYLLILVAYMISGKMSGIVCTLASISIILTVNFFVDLQLSQVAINSAILGLIIGSFLSSVYTNKITNYENSLKKQNSSLSVLASTDYLTGIMNRRMFNEISERYFQTAQKNELNLTLLLLDLDHFKKVNDTYGHQAGDQLLKRFVETLERILNKSDIFARIGGEEFAILLSQINSDDAYILAERIRKEIENDFITYEGQDIFITTSIGISENKETDTAFEDIFSRADMALYRAKHEGRNTTCYTEFSKDDIDCPHPTIDNEVLNYSI
ncbi:MAG: GGDEF domain-containing protein [Sulfurovum sp.]|uniref:GGDEF domain-containing protein n=1 Tax=Sulfurovum sp. TaxID=1969726 RepID=UPI002867F1E0|nr:GGDEF domain-containing protein [Sulfurovum sp.]MCO4845419.1 GGDEF domain-containing protein [Sulfurovum sp.]